MEYQVRIEKNNVQGPCTARPLYAVVIGGMNMDICGSPQGPLVMHDSNPGSIRLRPGGVGRNIAHNLRLLGLEVSLVTALGGDLFSKALEDSCRELGIGLEMSVRLPRMRSGAYLYVTDESGDMRLAVSDMAVTAELTPERLAPHMEQINRADAVVLDANLPAETLRYVAENCTAPLYADPVSTVKALKLRGILDKLYAIKPNALEAEALTGEPEPERAALALLGKGVKRVFISLGSQGLLAAGEEGVFRVPARPTQAVNANGAGDAATAALVWAGVTDLDLRNSATAAAIAGAMTAASPETNGPELKELPEIIRNREGVR